MTKISEFKWRKLPVIGVAWLLHLPCLAQDSSTVKIKILEYRLNFYPANCDSTYNFRINQGRHLSINLMNCFGRMEVMCLDDADHIVEKGNYVNSLGLLKEYRTQIEASSLKKTITVVAFYQPLRDGTWFFYNTNGRLIKKIKYNKGIVVD